MFARIASEILAEKEPYHCLAYVVEYGAGPPEASQLSIQGDCERFYQTYRTEIAYQLRRARARGYPHRCISSQRSTQRDVYIAYRAVSLRLYRDILKASRLDVS